MPEPLSRAERRREERKLAGVSDWNREFLEEQYLERDGQLKTCSDAFTSLHGEHQEERRRNRILSIGIRQASGFVWLTATEAQIIETVLLRYTGPAATQARQLLRSALDSCLLRTAQLNPEPKPAIVPESAGGSDAPIEASDGGDGRGLNPAGLSVPAEASPCMENEDGC